MIQPFGHGNKLSIRVGSQERFQKLVAALCRIRYGLDQLSHSSIEILLYLFDGNDQVPVFTLGEGRGRERIGSSNVRVIDQDENRAGRVQQCGVMLIDIAAGC